MCVTLVTSRVTESGATARGAVDDGKALTVEAKAVMENFLNLMIPRKSSVAKTDLR